MVGYLVEELSAQLIAKSIGRFSNSICEAYKTFGCVWYISPKAAIMYVVRSDNKITEFSLTRTAKPVAPFCRFDGGEIKEPINKEENLNLDVPTCNDTYQN
ncbi:unnamed protein product [Enterobius vermicularis]|uniref:DUF3700 domain-containing protein n=1 Tax=Enterobius vermicularis TaxID=51028 RepID=A0A0N4VPD0_ENTVE|nr:unnamed protein product [Enterobius vermicularis]